MRLFRALVLHQLTPFWIQLCYFVAVSIFGFGLLGVLKPRTHPIRPRNLDLFFTSVSATTVSSMSTVEIEVFSNAQLLVMTLLMFSGGDVFLTMAELFLRTCSNQKRFKIPKNKMMDSSVWGQDHQGDDVEMTTVIDGEGTSSSSSGDEVSMHRAVRFLGLVVLGYLIIAHLVGISTVLGYITFVLSARDVLTRKGLHRLTFAVFTTVSTFTNCGFVPTNENMAVFARDWGLLLLLIPQSLLGNTLFPPFLRATVWAVGRFGFGTAESAFLLKRTKENGYHHLLPSLRDSWLLVATVAALVLVQVVMFCVMEWDSAALVGLSRFQKLVGIVFQCVNSRHTGESVVNLAILSPPILVLFVFMMYLPPHTSFHPRKHEEEQSDCVCVWERNDKKGRGKVAESILFSQLSYLVIFVIVICITERRQMKEDPINFSVLNIVVEVISAYSNVGFTIGYSCELRLVPDTRGCVDKWFGFSGKWTDEGKIVLMVVIFLGRLKKFNLHGGKAWKLS